MFDYLNEFGLSKVWESITNVFSDVLTTSESTETESVQRDADTLAGHLPSDFVKADTQNGFIVTLSKGSWILANNVYTLTKLYPSLTDSITYNCNYYSGDLITYENITDITVDDGKLTFSSNKEPNGDVNILFYGKLSIA